MNELECIRAFVKVVEVGSFAETARQTNTAKSVITKRVAVSPRLLVKRTLQNLLLPSASINLKTIWNYNYCGAQHGN